MPVLCQYKRMLKRLFFLVSILFLSNCSINQESRDYYRSKNIKHGIIPLDSKVAQKFNEASVQRGRQLYEAHCMSCHGNSGRGDGPLADRKKSPPDLIKLSGKVKNFKFYMSISQWQGDMPGWKEPFNDSDRDDLVAYIKSLK